MYYGSVISALGVHNYEGPGQPNGIAQEVEVGLYKFVPEEEGGDPSQWELLRKVTVGPESQLIDGYRYEPIEEVVIKDPNDRNNEFAIVFASGPSATGVGVTAKDEFSAANLPNHDSELGDRFVYKRAIVAHSTGALPESGWNYGEENDTSIEAGLYIEAPLDRDISNIAKFDVSFLYGYGNLSQESYDEIVAFGGEEHEFVAIRGNASSDLTVYIPSSRQGFKPLHDGMDLEYADRVNQTYWGSALGVSPDGSAFFVDSYDSTRVIVKVDLSTGESSYLLNGKIIAAFLGDADMSWWGSMAGYNPDGTAVRYSLRSSNNWDGTKLIEFPIDGSDPYEVAYFDGYFQTADREGGRDRIIYRNRERNEYAAYDIILRDLNTNTEVTLEAVKKQRLPTL
jgi:hypothetical protein